jgi:hypothetical protein
MPLIHQYIITDAIGFADDPTIPAIHLSYHPYHMDNMASHFHPGRELLDNIDKQAGTFENRRIDCTLLSRQVIKKHLSPS